MRVIQFNEIGPRQFDILKHLAAPGGNCSLAELRSAVSAPGEERTCTYKAVKRLEARGMVSAGERTGRDKRFKTLGITDAGLRAFKEAESFLINERKREES